LAIRRRAAQTSTVEDESHLMSDKCTCRAVLTLLSAASKSAPAASITFTIDPDQCENWFVHTFVVVIHGRQTKQCASVAFFHTHRVHAHLHLRQEDKSRTFRRTNECNGVRARVVKRVEVGTGCDKQTNVHRHF
jgi:hypothetical protein